MDRKFSDEVIGLGAVYVRVPSSDELVEKLKGDKEFLAAVRGKLGDGDDEREKSFGSTEFPEALYSEEEMLKYKAVADLLGVRICDLTADEKRLLVSSEYKCSVDEAFKERTEYTHEEIEEIRNRMPKDGDKIAEVLKSRISVYPTFYDFELFYNYALKPYSYIDFSEFREYFTEAMFDRLTDFGANYEKAFLDMMNRLRDGMRTNGKKEFDKVENFIVRFVNPLRRYFAAVCKLEPKIVNGLPNDDRTPEVEWLNPNEISFGYSFLHSIVIMNYYKNFE